MYKKIQNRNEAPSFMAPRDFTFNVPLSRVQYQGLYEALSIDLSEYGISELILANLVLTIKSTQRINLVAFRTVLEAAGLPHKVPRLFSGVSVKFVESGKTVTGIFFETGRIVLVGIKDMSYTLVCKVMTTVAYLLSCAGMRDFANCEINISNTVYSFKVLLDLFPTSLVDFYNTMGPKYIAYLEYNPSAFPGLTMRVPDSSAVLLLFNSRKCILTGGKRKDARGFSKQFYKAISFLKKLLAENKVMNKK